MVEIDDEVVDAMADGIYASIRLKNEELKRKGKLVTWDDIYMALVTVITYLGVQREDYIRERQAEEKEKGREQAEAQKETGATQGKSGSPIK